jgi:adenylate cyclase
MARPVQSNMAINPRFSLYYFLQAAALALAGRVEEARPIVGQSLELEPAFRSSTILEHGLTWVVVDRLIEGARLLGLPE